MLNRLIEAFSAIVILLPVFLIFGKGWFRTLGRRVVCFFFAVYLCAVYSLTGLPTSQFFTFDVNLQLIPLAGIREDGRNAVLNAVLFVPLGFLLPLLWRSFERGSKTIFFGLGMSVCIELLQLFTFRATDINDILTNTLGTAAGFGIFQILNRHRSKLDEGTERELFTIMLIVAGVMFFAQPWISSFIYRVM